MATNVALLPVVPFWLHPYITDRNLGIKVIFDTTRDASSVEGVKVANFGRIQMG